MSGFNRLVKNSFSNIINGFSNVILGIVISPVLLHTLSNIDFSIWSLTLQVGVLVGIVGIGIQVTVGRFVALYLTDLVKMRRAMQQSLFFTLILAAFCFSLVIIVSTFFFQFFPEVADTTANAKLVFVLISSSFVLNNIAAPYVGYFTGIERNDITASVNIVFKILLGSTIVMSVHKGLDVIAWIYFSINALNQIAFFVLYHHKIKRDIKTNIVFDRQLFKKIALFFSGLLVWNIAQFLISGIGVFTVGKYAFPELAGFAVLMTLVNTGVGLLGAVINPIIQPMLRMHNSGNNQHVEFLVNKLTLVFALLVFIGVFIAWHLSIHILGVWLGYDQAAKLHILFSVLLASYLIRMIAAPYGLMLVAYGKQLSIAYLPIIEGFLNLALSIYFVRNYGAIGIAWSTFISGILIMAVYAFKYHSEAELKVKAIFLSFIFLPVVIAVGLFVLLTYTSENAREIIYCLQALFSIVFIVIILKQIKNIKILLNQY